MWTSLISNPEWAITVIPGVQELLDTLETLIPIPSGDRYCAMSDWLNEARQEGLITSREFHAIKHELAQVM